MGSSPGFGSNQDNLPGIVDTPPPGLAIHPTLARFLGPPRESRPHPGALCPPGHALFGLAFAAAPELLFLNLAAQINSPAHSSIGTQSSRQVGTSTVCRSAVSGLFHSPLGVLFTFPSRYWFTIGGQEYLALEGGPPGFPQDFTCPVVLNSAPEASCLSPTGLSPSTVVPSRLVRLNKRFVTSLSVLGSE